MKKLTSWGMYPYGFQSGHECYWKDEVSTVISELSRRKQGFLAYGQGRSYGDSCMACSDHVLHTSGLNKFIDADWENGVVKIESGVTLEHIIHIALPNGWFLPVTPGTKHVSVGGAIANDVHGKNHHLKGTFGNHVLSFGLARSDGKVYRCSRLENADLFGATIGGLGMTGVMVWVELQLMPVTSNIVDVTTIRFSHLNEFFQLSEELDDQHEYSVAWVDCLAKGKNIGRGVFMVGDHAKCGLLKVNEKKKITLPFTPPVSMVNKFTLPLLNAGYYRMHRDGRSSSKVGYDPFFYPLDGIRHWNRAYGPKGFQQYQCIIPREPAETVIRQLMDVIASAKTGSFLAVLKRCGDIESPGILSFPMPGVSLALDFPQHDSISQTLFDKLDLLVREAKGRLYPAKDAHMSAADFQVFYPGWDVVENLRDPAICSKFWRRVTTL